MSGCESVLTNILIRRGIQTRRDSRVTCAQKEDPVRRWQEGGHLQTKKTCLRRNQP